MTETLAVQTAQTPEDTLKRMRERLKGVVPDVELQLKADLVFEINQLKVERNAVILGHNYMEPALFHSVPDYTGDSLELSRQSAETDADIILFCGVQFMAETAKILSPHKTVLIPSLKAGCSLAAGITAADVRLLKKWYPDAPVVTYVNTYADVKAESDYCCTSGNAIAVVTHLLSEGHRQIIFLPDEYLARNTAAELGLDFVLPPVLRSGEPVIGKEPTIIGWRARCEVHEKFRPEDVHHVREQFPDVAVLAHPECSPEVVAESDKTGSTKQLIKFVRELDAPQYLLLTECSMGDNIAAENPDKDMLRLCSFRCPYMNEITVEDTLDALRYTQYEVSLPPEIIERARIPIDRMLEIH
jgi:quinolinate synthase